MASKSIIFTQPFNELAGFCLRIEQMLSQIQFHADKTEPYDSRAALCLLVEMVQLFDRPDFRGKLTKELMRIKEYFQSLIDHEGVDHRKLTEIGVGLQQHIYILENQQGKFSKDLRSNEFINTICLALARPGGSNCFDTPLYHYWLHEPAYQRHQDFNVWLKELEPIVNIIKNYLMLIRYSGKEQVHLAKQGFYQENLQPKLNYQLLCIELDMKEKAFPEISVGRHRLTIRFREADIHDKPKQVDINIPFKLTYCIL